MQLCERCLADDKELKLEIINTDAEANDILREIPAIAHPYALTINAEKTKALTTEGSPCTLYLDNSQIEQVAEFKYFGSTGCVKNIDAVNGGCGNSSAQYVLKYSLEKYGK
ncbi:unnamed protein product [Heligmosomoides polygyrus]|uniref:Thioredoxin n=1 Tax=Heligmosomoides polygyrus TaxID=6339 RepID=A0A183FCC8_HELPZ|nr:unnamed protein product [Heligmosomoides polygyrus]